MVFLLTLTVLHHLLFDALFFFSSCALPVSVTLSCPTYSTLTLTELLPSTSLSSPPSLPLSLILPPCLMSSLPNTLHISFPSLHLPLSLILSPRPAPSNPLPADSAAGFWALTSLCVRWEQVTPQGAGWPHCVTFTPTQINFVWDAASRLEAPFKLVWATWKNEKNEPEAGNTGTHVYTTVRHTVYLQSFLWCAVFDQH